MQDKWYGDNRDIVKWATVLHLAEQHGIERILQVAFWRPYDFWGHDILENGVGRIGIPQTLREHFPRDVRDISRLGQATGVAIEVFDGVWGDRHDQRNEYVDAVVTKIVAHEAHPLIVFLDPDTGIEPPRGGDLRHVRPCELKRIFEATQRGSILVFYQHRRHDRDWLATTRREFCEAIVVADEEVSTFTCFEVANDVAFFAVRKP